MGDIAIKVENLSKVYKLYNRPIDRLKESLSITKKKLSKEFYALKEINFEIKKGETVGIIGTNGSGKSTILKIITGVLNETTGNVTVQGRISALLELGAGFNTEYTGLENIYLNGTMLGFSKEEIESKIEEILKFADIGDFIYQPVKTYSSGMFVRLAFAVAINIDPEILIVDEALSVGDVFFQAKCYHKFEEFKKNGKTILFVSHDLGSISKYCDKAVLLNRGKKVKEGSTKEVIDIYKKILVNQLDETNEKKIEEINRPSTDLWQKTMNCNPKKIEYGNKKAEIIDFAIEDSRERLICQIKKGDDFIIKIKVKFNSEIQQPIIAFTIKDLKGNEITGTNTFLESTNIDKCLKDDIIVVTFKQNMNLQGGEYLFSFGCTGYFESEFVVYHRLYDICNLTVISDKNTVGYYDMNTEVSFILN